jgi:hypothetical protein
MIRRYVLFLAALGCVLYVASTMNDATGDDGLFAPAGTPAKTLKFSHAFHVGESGMACADCHGAAKSTSLSSGLRATHDNCTTCHQEQVDGQCGYCHIDPQNIPPVETVRPEIIFSHQQHAGLETAQCGTCHAGVEKADAKAVLHGPSMETCNTCHNDRNVGNTCEMCHTNFVALVPAEHKLSGFRSEHKHPLRLGALDVECATCHSERFCGDCHGPAGLKQFGNSRDLMSDPTPKLITQDNNRPMSLQNTHSLNYRFFHGIDAKSRVSECSACHEAQSFCAQCHDAGGNITQVKFKPSSHSMPGFTTLGRGSGGGIHAAEARRDMDNCASCHDLEGRDPSCLTCHLDNGQVR